MFIYKGKSLQYIYKKKNHILMSFKYSVTHKAISTHVLMHMEIYFSFGMVECKATRKGHLLEKGICDWSEKEEEPRQILLSLSVILFTQETSQKACRQKILRLLCKTDFRHYYEKYDSRH